MFDRYLDFQGRLGRKQYLINMLKFIGVAFAYSFVAAFICIVLAKLVHGSVGVLLAIPAGIVYLYYSFRFTFSQAAKRAHDLGHSGWSSLLFMVPLVGLFAHIYFMVAPGQDHDNAYGVRNSG